MIKLKRIYQPKSPEDGYRVLVDRLWPRGISQSKAGLDLWLKEIAPSDELRQWFNHDPKKWPEFQSRYQIELKTKADELNKLKSLEKEQGTITLLYGAKNEQYNQAVVIAKLLSQNK
jgi:uncharacterized protein YeaO (DUF488 family)